MINKVLLILTIVVTFAIGYFAGRKTTAQNISEYDRVYAKFNGGQVKGEDVMKIAGQEIRDLEKSAFEIKKRVTQDIIKEKMNIPPDGYALDSIKISPVEIEAVLKERKLSHNQVSEIEISNIVNNLKLQKSKKTEAERFTAKLESSEIRFHIPLPTLQRIKIGKGALPGRGSFWAPVEVISFTNYQCGQCALAETHLQELNKKFENKLKIFYRYKGIDPKDSVAFLSVEAGLCANDQDKYWEFHDSLIKKPPQVAEEILQVAEELKIKNEKFDECLKKHVHQKEVEQDQFASQALPQDSVPFLIINNQVISGLETIEALSDVIESEL